MMKPELQKKVDRAVKLLQSAGKIAADHGQPLEICYSGGKDSDVILELAKMANINYRAIYKNTTIDPPGTIKHALARGAEMIRPQTSFLNLLRRKGWPTRRARFCCEKLKEYKILDYAAVGIRRDESPKRGERYKEPETCRVYNAKDKVRMYFPILDWTIDDVANFLKERNVTCAPIYYDEDGTFHPERRLGCMCCPMASRGNRLEGFKRHPNMVKLYLRGGNFYRNGHTMEKNKKYFRTIYDWFVCYLFCDSIQEFRERFGPNLFDEGINCKEFLENYFNIKLNNI